MLPQRVGMDKTVLKIVNLKKTYFDFNHVASVTALEKVNLEIYENEFFSLVGPSGCGKSTLLYILAGLLKQTDGEIFFDHAPIHGPSAERGMVFQEWALLPWKTVYENIELGLKLRRVPKADRTAVIDRFLRLVNLEKFVDKYPYELSGGMKQRVGLARALANNPRVIFFDEPFASVDAQTRLTLQEELLRIWMEEKKTMLLVTHSVDEAIFLSERIGVMSSRPGKIKEIVRIDLPRPRTWSEIQDHAHFHKLRNHILEAVRQEVLAGNLEEK